MARKKKEEKLDYVSLMNEAYLHWQDEYENGCYDPNNTDGVNLNLVRNHIRFYQKHILVEIEMGLIEPFELPELPPEVPYDYMARLDEKNAHILQFEEEVKHTAIYKEYKDFMHLYNIYGEKKDTLPYICHLIYRLEDYVRGLKAKEKNLISWVLPIRQFGEADMLWLEKKYDESKEKMDKMLEKFQSKKNTEKITIETTLFVDTKGLQLSLF